MAAYVTGIDLNTHKVYWNKCNNLKETVLMADKFYELEFDRITTWAVEPSFKNEHFVNYYPDSETIHEFGDI